MFVTQQTAPRLLPPGVSFPWKKAGLSPRALRTDRILQEIHDTGGDVRRVCDLFGLGIDAAMRYTQTLQPVIEDHSMRAGVHDDDQDKEKTQR